jgi:hypothetical protein
MGDRDKIAEMLHTAIWLHWSHNHTQGRYQRALDYQARPSYDYNCGRSAWHSYDGGRYAGMAYRAATESVRSRPEFQMPDTIPWLPLPSNNTEEAIVEAAWAVRIRMH